VGRDERFFFSFYFRSRIGEEEGGGTMPFFSYTIIHHPPPPLPVVAVVFFLSFPTYHDAIHPSPPLPLHIFSRLEGERDGNETTGGMNNRHACFCAAMEERGDDGENYTRT
jgi:hypothetical protein